MKRKKNVYVRVTFWVTPAQAKHVKQLAKANKKSASALIREMF